MTTTELKGVVRAVVRRAQRQGHVSPDDVRDELKRAGLSRTLWKDVVSQARAELSYREGSYYYVAPDPGVQEEHRHQLAVRRAVRKLVRQHRRSADQDDRRREGRVDFIQPITVRTEDGRAYDVLSRDVSPTGLRFLGARGFLGQKLRVSIPSGEEEGSFHFWVRVLWTCTVGDQLFENGGSFLEVAAEKPDESVKLVLVS